MILSIDVGSSSVRAALFDPDGNEVPETLVRVRVSPFTSADGGMWYDAEELAQIVFRVMSKCLKTGPAREFPIAAVGFSTFMHSLVGTDNVGRPTTPLFSWGDTRSRRSSKKLLEVLDPTELHARTGSFLHSSYWPLKLVWLRKVQPGDFRKTRKWLSFGDFLFLKLFGRTSCGLSVASATGMMNRTTLKWDEVVAAKVGISPERLPEIAPPGTRFHGADLETGFSKKWPKLATAAFLPAFGDGACSNFGNDCRTPDRIAMNVGTTAGVRVCLPAGKKLKLNPEDGLWEYRVDEQRLLVGGALSNAGNSLAWVRRNFRFPSPEHIRERLETRAPGSHGLSVLPFLAGERSPDWNDEAVGVIAGLRLDNDPMDVLHAFLESLAARLSAIAKALYRTRAARPDAEIIVSGGVFDAYPVLLNMLSTASGRPIRIAENSEGSLRGAALLTGECIHPMQ